MYLPHSLDPGSASFQAYRQNILAAITGDPTYQPHRGKEAHEAHAVDGAEQPGPRGERAQRPVIQD
jgi:hypothetical protein